MGYYVRFLQEDDRPLSLDEIMTGLRAVDPGFALTDDLLTRDGERLAVLDVSRPGDDLFAEEISELREAAEDAGGPDVAARLGKVTAIVAVQVLFQGRGTEETLGLLDPLWQWLTVNQHGLMQADGEGYYDGDELVLEVD